MKALILLAALILASSASAQIIPSGSGGSCPTCVLATSPGVGLAHFAGSTQTVTSSLVAIGDLSASGTPNSTTFLRGDNTWAAPGGSGTVTVVGAGTLTSTALVTGGGAQALQTPSATTTLSSGGALAVAAGGSLGSADTGTPKFTFATNSVSLNQPLTFATTSNQVVFGTTTNLTTLSFPASSGAVTLTMPNTADTMVGRATTDTLTNKSIAGSEINSGTVPGAQIPVVGTVVDTSSPVTVSTTLAAEYHFNENATAATAMTYNLPTASAGKQFCISNAFNGSAANTGVLTIATSATGQFITFTDGTLSATGGNVTSGGAAADAACVVGIDSTHWMLYTQRGTWTKH